MADDIRPEAPTGTSSRHRPTSVRWRVVHVALTRVLATGVGTAPDQGSPELSAAASGCPDPPTPADSETTGKPPHAAPGPKAPASDATAARTGSGEGGTPPERLPLEVLKHGMWRHVAMDRVGRLGAVTEAMASAHRGVDLGGVRGSLQRAQEIAREGELEGRRLGILSPARTIENCWRALHLAEEELLHRIPADDHARIEVAVQQAQEHARRHLTEDHVAFRALTALVGRQDAGAADQRGARTRDAALEVVRASHAVSTAQHRRQRRFQNQLRLLSTLLVLLAAGAVAVFALGGGTDGLIPVPSELPGSTAALLLALALGALGALFSAVPSLSQLPAQSSPFDPVREQAALKIVVGAWSAVIGLVVVRAGVSGVDTGGSDPGTFAGWAVMAAVFGATQEAVTRFADRKAGEVAPTSR